MDLRDVVRSSAFNLAGQTDCGIRLEIAHHLMPNFKALNRASYKLRQKYASCKRNIKYDDEKADLVLDFKTTAEASWKKLRPDQARELERGLGDAEELSASDMSELLEAGEAEDTLTGANAEGSE